MVSKCSFDPSGNAGEQRDALFPEASTPPITSLPALQVRHDDDLHDPENDACDEQGEFDGHVGEYAPHVRQEPTVRLAGQQTVASLSLPSTALPR
jgi:hypothetical protein